MNLGFSLCDQNCDDSHTQGTTTASGPAADDENGIPILQREQTKVVNYNMTVWILAGNYISFTIAAGLIRLHMPGVKKSRV